MAGVKNQKISSENRAVYDINTPELPKGGWPTLNKGGRVNDYVVERKIEAVLKPLPMGDKLLVLAFIEALYGLPENPPEYYASRDDKSENIIDFIERVYFKRGVAELPRPYLRQKDPRAYQALNNWLKKHELPKELRMPKRRQELDEQMSKLATDFPGTSDKIDAMARVLAAMKLRAAPK